MNLSQRKCGLLLVMITSLLSANEVIQVITFHRDSQRISQQFEDEMVKTIDAMRRKLKTEGPVSGVADDLEKIFAAGSSATHGIQVQKMFAVKEQALKELQARLQFLKNDLNSYPRVRTALITYITALTRYIATARTALEQKARFTGKSRTGLNSLFVALQKMWKDLGGEKLENPDQPTGFQKLAATFEPQAES